MRKSLLERFLESDEGRIYHKIDNSNRGYCIRIIFSQFYLRRIDNDESASAGESSYSTTRISGSVFNKQEVRSLKMAVGDGLRLASSKGRATGCWEWSHHTTQGTPGENKNSCIKR